MADFFLIPTYPDGIGFPAPTLAPRDAVEKRQDSGATDGADLASGESSFPF